MNKNCDTDDNLPYTPETLTDMAKQIEDLRMSFLFDLDSAGADPESEQYFLLALSDLESANRFMKLAVLKQRQGIVGRL